MGAKFRYGTSFAIPAIRENVANGNIRTTEIVATESHRLDIMAGEHYGDGRLFWVIAAASGVGHSLQVPPGTRILIPNLSDLIRFVG